MADHLSLAEGLTSQGEYRRAVVQWDAAFGDVSDPQREQSRMLYKAARAAALAADASEGTEAASMRGKALSWLRADLSRRKAEVEALADAPRAKHLRALMTRHSAHARLKEADFASIRDMSEFDRIFEEVLGPR